jgi:phosphatidate cytidylyltransferase
MTFNTQTFVTRTASAAVFVFVLLSCVWYNSYSFIAFFTLVGFVGIYEFYKLSEKSDKKPQKFFGYALHILSVASVFFMHRINLHQAKPYLLILILAGPLYLLVELFKEKKSVFNNPAVVLSFLYVTLPCILLILLSGIYKSPDTINLNFHPQKVLGILFFIWINDTGAYLVGSFFGKHKLYEKISPNKTWEGTIGGIALCIAFSFVIAKLFPQLELKHWVIISIIVAVFGTLGDLVESMLKRLAGVKDTGNIMPGHGGVLDRFDSLLFSTPFVFCYLAAVGLL